MPLWSLSSRLMLFKTKRALFVVSALALLGALLGGVAWYRAEARERVARESVPARPSLDNVSPALVGRISEAETDIHDGKNSVEALKTLARLYHANGYSEQAIQLYDTLALIDPANVRWPHLQATLLAGTGRLEEALPLLRTTVQRAPNYLPARIRLADALLKLNQPDAAKAVYREVLTRDQNNVYALLGLARCEIDASHWSAAEQHLQQAVKADANFSAGWMLLATVMERHNDNTAAERARRQAAKGTRFQDVPDPWADDLLDECYDPYKLRVAAAVLDGAGNPTAAMRILERTVQLSPNDAAAHRELGRIYLAQNDVAAARSHLEKAVAVGPADADNWIGLFKLATTTNDPGAASRAILAGLSHCPDSPALRLEHGRQLLAYGRLDEALAEFMEAKRLRPNEADAVIQMAIVYFKRGDMKSGIARMQEALQIEPDHPMASLALARYAIDTGNEADARAWMTRIRRQTRVRPEDLTEVVAAFQEKFGHAPPGE